MLLLFQQRHPQRNMDLIFPGPEFSDDDAVFEFFLKQGLLEPYSAGIFSDFYILRRRSLSFPLLRISQKCRQDSMPFIDFFGVKHQLYEFIRYAAFFGNVQFTAAIDDFTEPYYPFLYPFQIQPLVYQVIGNDSVPIFLLAKIIENASGGVKAFHRFSSKGMVLTLVRFCAFHVKTHSVVFTSGLQHHLWPLGTLTS